MFGCCPLPDATVCGYALGPACCPKGSACDAANGTCVATGVSAAAPNSIQLSAWSSFRGDPSGRGLGVAPAPKNWANLGVLAPEIAFTTGGPAIAFSRNGTHLFASDAGTLYALDTVSGAIAWRRPCAGAASAPALSLDGRALYVGCGASLLALDTDTGGLHWNATEGSNPAVLASSPTISPDGKLVLFGASMTVYGVDARTGTRAWSYVSDGDVSREAPPAVSADGTAYFGTSSKTVFAVSALTGKLAWKTAVGGRVDGAGPAVDAAGGTVYVTADDGRAYALDATASGKLKATYSCQTPSNPKDWCVNAPALGPLGKAVFVGTAQSSVLAFNAQSGARLWARANAAGNPLRGSPVVSADGATVSVGNGAHGIALNAKTGAVVGEFCGGGVSNVPAVSGCGGGGPRPDAASPVASQAISSDGVAYHLGGLDGAAAKNGIHLFGLTASYVIRALHAAQVRAAQNDTAAALAVLNRTCVLRRSLPHHVAPVCDAQDGCNVCAACCQADTSNTAPGVCVDGLFKGCVSTNCAQGPQAIATTGEAVALVNVACQAFKNAQNGAGGWFAAWEGFVDPMSYTFYKKRIDPGSGDLFLRLQAYEAREAGYLAQIADVGAMIGFANASQRAVTAGDVPNWQARLNRSKLLLRGYGQAVKQIETRMTAKWGRLESDVTGVVDKLNQRIATLRQKIREAKTKAETKGIFEIFVGAVKAVAGVACAFTGNEAAAGKLVKSGVEGIVGGVKDYQNCAPCDKMAGQVQELQAQEKNVLALQTMLESAHALDAQISGTNATLPALLPAIETDRMTFAHVSSWLSVFKEEMGTTNAVQVDVLDWVAEGQQHLALLVSWYQTAMQVQDEQGQLSALRARAKLLGSFKGTQAQVRNALARGPYCRSFAERSRPFECRCMSHSYWRGTSLSRCGVLPRIVCRQAWRCCASSGRSRPCSS